ncbi:MAG: DUF4190 domain-containing protein [bacterium]|nr:DUF4190 domain-containing protein [bacterium]
MDDRYDREERRDGGTWGGSGPKDVPAAEEFPWQESSGGGPGTGWDTPAADYGSGHPPQQVPVGQGAGTVAPPGNGMAVAGFVLSILALILCWLSLIDLVFILPAIVFSAIGLRRANKQARPHRGLAIAGLSISLVATVIMIVLTIIYVQVADDITSTPVATRATTTTLAATPVTTRATTTTNAVAPPNFTGSGCPTLRPGVNDVSSIPQGQTCRYEFEAGEINYWERLSGFGGSFDEIITNGIPNCEQTIVELFGSDIGFKWDTYC